MAELVVHFSAKRDETKEATVYLHLSEASLTRPHPKGCNPKKKKTRKAEHICISQRYCCCCLTTPEKEKLERRHIS